MGCNIDKMLIKGIRSFSPENLNVIEFYRPLTIIVGQNGAGKTTVIECLKMACTGELPPNTRSGQSFIHDPKVAGETEVKAQIKLRFMTATRQPVVIIRSFQLTQKKATMQFKALDNVLQTVNRTSGQKEALSYRCADIDRIVPSLMGVSKAILENVIFVHQEDSNWPLAEGQVLKKKFDDIFAATKYTKALEALRKLRTEKTQEVREMKLKLEHLKTEKDVATRLQSEVEGGSRRAADLDQQAGEVEKKIREHSKQMEELNGQLNAIRELADEVKEARARHDLLARQNGEARARLLSAYGPEDLEIGLEELEEWEKDAEPDAAEADANLKKVQREAGSKGMEVEAIKEQYTRDVKKQGRLAAEAEAHLRNVADRDKFLRLTLAPEAQLPAPPVGADGRLSGEAVAEFRRLFGARLEEAGRQLDTAKASHRTADDDAGRSLDKVSAELSGAAEGVRMKREQLRRQEASLAGLGEQIELCVVNAAMLAEAQQRERDYEAQLKAKQDFLSASKLDEEMRQASQQLGELQGRASALRQERDRLAAAADSASRLRYKVQEVAARQEQMATLLATRRAKLDALLGLRGGELPPADQLKARVEAAIAQRKADLEAQAQALKDVQAQLASAEGQEQALNTQRHKAHADLAPLAAQLEQGLRDACSDQAAPSDLHACTVAVEEQQRAASQTAQQLAAFQTMGQHIVDAAQSRNVCVTCSRPFVTEQERQAFLAKQAQEQAMLPGRLADVQGRLQQAEARVRRLKQLQPVALRHDQLRDRQLPELDRQLADVRARIAQLRERLGDVQEEYAAAEAEHQEGQRLLSEAAWPIDRLAREVREKQVEVDALKAQTATTNAVRTVSDVDADLEDLDRQRARLEAQKEDAGRRLQRLRDEVANIRGEHYKAKEEVTRLSSAADRRKALEAQVVQLQEEGARLQQQIEAAAAQRRPLEERKAALEQERERRRAEARQREGELEQRLRTLHTLETQLQAKDRAIEVYERGGGAGDLAHTNKNLEDLKRRQEQLEREIKELQAVQRQLEEDVRDKAGSKRQIQDLLGFQRSKAQQAQLAQRLEEVERAIAQVGNPDALAAAYRQHQAEVQQLRSERDHMLGALATVRDTVERARGELGQKQYNRIEERYREHLIMLKTTEMANSDLEKYHKALEKALLAFHTSKMADINKVVKELWQKTYRNSDIDYIAIKTDAEGGAARSYNYRVVMYCGGAELDMRGRCSAGQKVLACLIIRLALAETFCLNCGILALDEPTTNLDAANAASLAESLRSIMTSRREQENFQLVVITHDENFAHLIGTREYCEYRWRITKDQDQHTLVTQEEIMD